jgi:uncharacterized protein (TIGR01777 family)
MATILITGGTGLIGQAISAKLVEKGHEVIIITRKSKPSMDRLKSKNVTYAGWNIEEQTIDKIALSKADYIIHLAGAGVADKRWTAKRKSEIVNSRVDSSDLLANSLKKDPHNVQAVVSASAIGWYGPDKKGRAFTEVDPPFTDFLGETCRLWEEAVERIRPGVPRIVKLRTGIVLSRRGGALKEFLKPMKFGIATVMGSGRQVISWIHIDDLVAVYLFALENKNINGSYNAVASEPLANREFIRRIARAKKGAALRIKVPSFLLKLVLGEMSIEVLKSCTVSNEKIRRAGFVFKFPTLEEATKELFQS